MGALTLQYVAQQQLTKASKNMLKNVLGAPNNRFRGNDLKWLVMHPGVL